MTTDKTSAGQLSIERADENDNGLFVDSQWRVDRFIHCVGVIQAGCRLPILHSCEGFPDDRWPVSPPLQQMSQQLIANDPALLAVGMAGTSHYSTSFLLQRKQQVELVVESACLVNKDEPKGSDGLSLSSSSLKLGSMYRLNSPFELVRREPALDDHPQSSEATSEVSNTSQHLRPLRGSSVTVVSRSSGQPVGVNVSVDIGLIAISDYSHGDRHVVSHLANTEIIKVVPPQLMIGKATQWSYRISLA